MSQLTLQDALNQAIGHHQSGKLPEAEQLYRAILTSVPNQPDALHLLGVIAHQVGQHAAAAELIEKSLSFFPANATAQNNLGEAYRALGNNEQAEQCYRKSLGLDPNFTAAHSNLGIVLHTLRRFEDAIASYQRALALSPTFVEAMNNLGNVLMDQLKFGEAKEWYQKAIDLNPNYAAAVNNLGASLERSDQLLPATVNYEKATQLDPNFAEAWNNLGSIWQKRQDFPTAMKFWRKTIEVRADHPDANWNLGLAGLALGDYDTGWRGYEWRWRCSHSRHYWREYTNKPRWDGSPLKGKTILLYPEQGFGDVIQFARFAPRVAALGGRVILEVHAELVDLMKGIEGVAEVIPQHSAPPEFDAYLALLSVPLTLNIQMSEVGGSVPYIKADDEKLASWKSRFAGVSGKRVGLVWAGKTIPDPKRTCPFEQLAPLLDVPGITFYSLQKGDAAAELQRHPAGASVLNLDSDLRDFSDTAAAMATMDLVISIDTAVCHLAGAMALNVWTMIPAAPDWRWMLERHDNPWYPSMKVFRQPTRDDWKTVIDSVKAELVAWVSAPR